MKLKTTTVTLALDPIEIERALLMYLEANGNLPLQEGDVIGIDLGWPLNDNGTVDIELEVQPHEEGWEGLKDTRENRDGLNTFLEKAKVIPFSRSELHSM